MEKIIVAHPARQHSFKTAEALLDLNMLDVYITSTYLKDKSLTKLVTKLLKGDLRNRAENRKISDMPDDKVIIFCEISGLFLLFLQRLKPLKLLHRIWWDIHNYRFNKKVSKYINKKSSADGIILYDQVSSVFFKKNHNKSVIKILDMSAPYFNYMDEIFANNISSYKQKKSIDRTYKRWQLKRGTPIEIKNADFFLVASNFTSKSLEENGIDRKKIIKCVYGCEIEHDGKRGNDAQSVNILFVGRFTEEKGAKIFVEFLEELQKETNIKFNASVVGAYESESNLFKRIKNFTTFYGHVPKSKMNQIFKEHDFLIFPSLADGFGLSVIEALAVGVPVICSSNAGASDLIINEYNGIVFNPAQQDDLFEAFSEIKKIDYDFLSKNAVKSIEKLTWENYGVKLQNELKKLE